MSTVAVNGKAPITVAPSKLSFGAGGTSFRFSASRPEPALFQKLSA